MATKITPNREFAFTLNDVARLLRTYADHRAAEFGITRAQRAAMARLDRPKVSSSRSLPRCSTSGVPIRMIGGPSRLLLTPAARPLLKRLGSLAEGLISTMVAGIGRPIVQLILAKLLRVRVALSGACNRSKVRLDAT